MSIAITLLALLVEATLGYPDRVLRAIGHPVMWLGRMIDWFDVTLNRDTTSSGRRKAVGFAAAFLIALIRLRDRRGYRQQPGCPTQSLRTCRACGGSA